MSRLKARITTYSPNAQTVEMSPAPPRKARFRIRVGMCVFVLLVDALVALPLGFVAAKYHLASNVVSLVASSWPQTRPSLPVRGPRLLPFPLPSEVSEDTFQRPDQPLWGTASGGGSWSGDASTNPAFMVSDHMGQITAANGTFTALLGPRLSSSELKVTFSIDRFNGLNNMGVVLRWESATRWYKVYLDGEGLVLIKRDAARILQLGSIPFPAQPGQPYNLLVQVQRSIFLAKAWTADSGEPAGWGLRVVDPSATWSSGYSGVRMYYSSIRSVTTQVTFFRETP